MYQWDPQLSERLRELDVRFLRISWVDNAGVLRCEAVRAEHADEMAKSGLGFVSAIQGLPVHTGTVQPGLGLGAVGQIWLRPDVQTLRIVPWQPTHASVLGVFVERDGKKWPFCPRAALERAMGRLAERGLSLQAGYEHEFQLLRREEQGFSRFETSGYCSARALDRGGAVIDDIAQALEAQGTQVNSMLKEAGLSQYEVATGHGDPVAAANHFVTARETIAAIAARHGLIGTCLPLVYGDDAGNGWHVHFSLWRDGSNLTGSGDALDPLAQHFLAGVLEHLPALLALTTPTVNSFRRKRPGYWTGAYRTWGFDHKESPLRVPTVRHGAPTNVELKASDATANPFLALTGLIAAGLDGLERALELPPATRRDPNELSEAERAKQGIELLPATIDESLELLEQDAVLTGALGAPLAKAYIAVKRAEAAEFGPLSIEEEAPRLIDIF